MPENPKYKATGKIDVDNLYTGATPADYVRFLYEHDYRLPQHATPIVKATLAQIRSARGKDNLRILDLGCSYGIMSAFLRHSLGLPDLYAHYHDGYDLTHPLDEIVRADISFYQANRSDDGLTIVGIDPSEPAIAYAKATGLLDDGAALSLEGEAPVPEAACTMLSDLDLVFSTGVIGYAGVRTITRLLELNTQSRPWMLNFVLRGVDYYPIAQYLNEQGYVTGRDRNVYRQRRFAGAEERTRWLDNLRRNGVDAAGYETTGYSCAELFLSRPADEAAAAAALTPALI